MMDILVLFVVIYVAIIAAFVTLMLGTTSGWFINRCNKTTEKIIEKAFEEE